MIKLLETSGLRERSREYQRLHVKLPGLLAEGSGSLKLVVAFYLSLFGKSVVNIA